MVGGDCRRGMVGGGGSAVRVNGPYFQATCISGVHCQD